MKNNCLLYGALWERTDPLLKSNKEAVCKEQKPSQKVSEKLGFCAFFKMGNSHILFY
jgi:hypothetical protein